MHDKLLSSTNTGRCLCVNSVTFDNTQAANAVDKYGLYGECYVDTEQRYVSVDGGETFTIGICIDGSVFGWGISYYAELGTQDKQQMPSKDDFDMYMVVHALPIQLSIPQTCTQVACGSHHVLSLTSNGSLYSWGWNSNGQTGHDSGINRTISTPTMITFDSTTPVTIKTMAAGAKHSLAIDAESRTWSWGSNEYGQLGFRSLQSESDHHVPAVLTTTPAATMVAAGFGHSALISYDKHLYTFGWGLYHQLGHNSTQDEYQPRIVDALEGIHMTNTSLGAVTMVDCGNWHTAVVTTTGDVYTFGWNRDCQLGHTDVDSQPLPRVVELPHDYFHAPEHEAIDVACGARHTVVLTRNGDVHWWGYPHQTRRMLSSSSDLLTVSCHKVRCGEKHSILLA